MVDIAAESDLSKILDHPMGPFLYTVSLMHCMLVGLVDNGSGLGMMWGLKKAVDMLAGLCRSLLNRLFVNLEEAGRQI